MDIIIRPAIPDDEPVIRALVKAERMNPTGLDWPRFFVAARGTEIVGAGQVRHHRDGSREMGSLVVRPDLRGQGIATRLVEARLAAEPGPLFTIVGTARANRYARWGFRPVAPRDASPAVRRHHRIGRMFRWLSWLKGKRALGLVILRRPAAADNAVAAAWVRAA